MDRNVRFQGYIYNIPMLGMEGVDVRFLLKSESQKKASWGNRDYLRLLAFYSHSRKFECIAFSHSIASTLSIPTFVYTEF